MSLLRSKISFFLILTPFCFSIAQRPNPDAFTISNFLPRPSPLPGVTLADAPPSLARPGPPPRVEMNLPPPPPPVAPPAIIAQTTDSNNNNNPNSISTSTSQNSAPILPLLLPTPNSPPFLRCNPKNTHPHPKTHKLLSQCRENTFCSSSGPSNGTCIPILCRRDEFPFGFGFGGGNTGVIDPNVELNELNLPIPVPTSTKRKSKKDRPKDLTTTMALPALCINGTFCPDDGSGCRQQNEIGGSCELGRDEQCAHPGNLTGVGPTIPTDAPVCLHLTCMYANATLNQPCIIENTTYVTDLHTGDPNGDGEATYTMNVIKHNCRSPGLFCDPEVTDATGPTCQPTKELKKNCRFDAECTLSNCAPDPKNANTNICAEPAGTPLHIAPWQWGATGFCIVGAMAAISILLTLVHRRHRHERHKELREYYHEQMSLRRSILALHAVAAERYSDEKPHEKT